MRYKVAPTIVGNDEYAVVHLVSTATGVEDCLTPQPPKGQGWRLINVVIVGTQFFQYWRRAVRKVGERAVHFRHASEGEQPACKVMSSAMRERAKFTRRKRDVTCKACRKSRLFREGRGER